MFPTQTGERRHTRRGFGKQTAENGKRDAGPNSSGLEGGRAGWLAGRCSRHRGPWARVHSKPIPATGGPLRLTPPPPCQRAVAGIREHAALSACRFVVGNCARHFPWRVRVREGVGARARGSLSGVAGFKSVSNAEFDFCT
ncbi:hypothetical protein AAFF_G00218220 [Aldrovandia affinis]|uniref:Uncharacterized protein n=1 Tax=Aldrovandia affinis TaxID=143900 RepID=A0AAD7SW75_9TELE|nr:hypothetical protein AAFF_G00218220 [Aldrovandia affinis]